MTFNYCPNCGQKGSVQALNPTGHECGNCGWKFWNNAKAAVALVFLHDGKVLYSKRGLTSAPNFGKYDLPAGFVDFDESAQAAAIREAREELGVEIQEKDLQLTAVFHNDYNPEVTSVDIIFLVTNWAHESSALDEVAAVEWKPTRFIHDPDFCEPYYGQLVDILEQIAEK